MANFTKITATVQRMSDTKKLQLRTLSSGPAVYTLIDLHTDYDVDTGENVFEATFHPDCERAITNRVSVDTFKGYIGKLGRQFDKDFQEVA